MSDERNPIAAQAKMFEGANYFFAPSKHKIAVRTEVEKLIGGKKCY